MSFTIRYPTARYSTLSAHSALQLMSRKLRQEGRKGADKSTEKNPQRLSCVHGKPKRQYLRQIRLSSRVAPSFACATSSSSHFRKPLSHGNIT